MVPEAAGSRLKEVSLIMKSVVHFFLAVAMVFITGCTSSKFVSHNLDLEFDGNQTTGYTWLFSVEDDSVIKVDEDIEYLGKPGVMGAPSLFKYKVHSLRPGSTSLKFEYRRPWETNDAAQVVVFDVTVDKDGNLNMIHKKM